MIPKWQVTWDAQPSFDFCPSLFVRSLSHHHASSSGQIEHGKRNNRNPSWLIKVSLTCDTAIELLVMQDWLYLPMEYECLDVCSMMYLLPGWRG